MGFSRQEYQSGVPLPSLYLSLLPHFSPPKVYVFLVFFNELILFGFILACIVFKHFHKFFTNNTATATAKSLQSCPTLCDPIEGSPPGSPVPGILQPRTLEWVAISFSNAWKWKVKVKSLSRVWPSATPWTAAHQAPPSMGFSRQEYWSGVPLPSPHVFYILSTLLQSNTTLESFLACSVKHIEWLRI